MNSTNSTLSEISLLESNLIAINGARYLELASLTVLIYDHIITLCEEIDFFWSGKWTLSRILFFLNRYLPLIAMMYASLSCTHVCDRSIRAGFMISLSAICINQGILVLRVWHMFSHSVLARLIAIVSYVACSATSLITLGVSFGDLRSQALNVPGISLIGCTAPPPSDIWKIFIPSIAIHTILYLFTAARALDGSGRFTKRPLVLRLLRDGGSIYFIAMVSVCSSAIGARMTGFPMINFPATYSNLTLVINSIAVSRLMFSVRSLAGKLGTDVRCLLNPAELSRVNWRVAAGGDIVVEMDTYEPPMTKNVPVV
ncbi:hypothetical protein BV22DRAFT_1013910 [Leucogyrophana mollusca]|uniref:Uncharacterized protein n=1 Tax=Leucogyrophana mollusca TaxID=85980 RepID=A0ACB8BEI8_9AGAM|nr:hypothetical protein BV22DRAFT_1013910 [Leucogyrophana mollusca]